MSEKGAREVGHGVCGHGPLCTRERCRAFAKTKKVRPNWCPDRVRWTQARDGRSKANYCLTTWTRDGAQHLCAGTRDHQFPMHQCACSARSSEGGTNAPHPAP